MSAESVRVVLTAPELEMAAFIASKRQTENLFKLRPDAHGAPRDGGWQLHIEGAAGELAVAKWADRFWNGNLGNLSADDVGTIQVRTAAKHTHCLILHSTDPDDKAFVLVTGLAPTFLLRGWIWGRDGKLPMYWNDPAGGRPAFFVPQSVLRPMIRNDARMAANA